MEKTGENSFEDISTLIKGMNYTLPTFKKEEGKVVSGLNTTIKFFNIDKENNLEQQGLDPRSLILVVNTFLRDLDPECPEFKSARILLSKAFNILEDKQLIKMKESE